VPSVNWDGNEDANGDGDLYYDPEQHVDEDPIDGIDNDLDGIIDEIPEVMILIMTVLGTVGKLTSLQELNTT
jgi:hypothetical protein